MLSLARPHLLITQFPRRVRCLPPNSPYVTIHPDRPPHQPNSLARVAPGLSLSYTISFHPDTSDDYALDLLIHTEREKFTVPFRALGARAALDFPDEITFPEAAVKLPQQKVVAVTNRGRRAGVVRFSTEGPFTVRPARGVLETGEVLQCVLGFCAPRAGQHEGKLVQVYDTGDLVSTCLKGGSVELPVSVDLSHVSFLDTYVTKRSQKVVHVRNDSAAAVDFRVINGPDSGGHTKRKFGGKECEVGSTFGCDAFSALPLLGCI